MESMSPEERSAFARAGGNVGGAARAASLTKKRRSEIAKAAVAARWERYRTAQGGKKSGKS